jgi:6-phosphogluconate dehydrogenase
MLALMRIAMVGLGRMGGNMTRRLMRGGHEVVAYDRDLETVRSHAAEGALPAESLEEAVALARVGDEPALVWVMVPAGPPTGATLESLKGLMRRGDVAIDGGNSNFKDTMKRSVDLAEVGVYLLDCGTSGGVWGLENGYCLMVGGAEVAFRLAEPVFATLAPPEGYLHAGPSGAGHFTKMVHNGIEYGMLQAYAEGFEIMAASPFELDLHAVSHLWNPGQSW